MAKKAQTKKAQPKKLVASKVKKQTASTAPAEAPKKAEKAEQAKQEDAKPEEVSAAAPAAPAGSEAPATAEAAPAKAKPGKAKGKAKSKAKRLSEMEAKEGSEKKDKPPRGTIYVGSIPKGFFEPQMRTYFAQFGKVTKVRHSRSRKNARSKGYAWVEFEELDVAKIAAETMNGYLLFGSKLKVHVVPADKVHPDLWKGSLRIKRDTTPKRRRIAREAYNNRPTVEVDGEAIPLVTTKQVKRKRDTRKDQKLKMMLDELGVGDFDPANANQQAAQTHFSPKTQLARSLSAKAAAAVPVEPLPEAAVESKKAQAKAAGKKKKAKKA